MQEQDNILRILKETRKAVKEHSPYKIKKLSNQTIPSATLSQDPDNIIVAVLVYSISKIVEREHYHEMDGWKRFYSSLIKDWGKAIEELEKNDLKHFRDTLGKIRNSLNKISGNLSEYMRDVFRKAEINKAFKIYEHGLSAEKTADLLGVSLWDLSSYIGQSSIANSSVSESLPVKKRIKYVEEIFS